MERKRATHKNPPSKSIDLVREHLSPTLPLFHSPLPDSLLDPISYLPRLVDEIRPQILLLEDFRKSLESAGKKEKQRESKR